MTFFFLVIDAFHLVNVSKKNKEGQGARERQAVRGGLSTKTALEEGSAEVVEQARRHLGMGVGNQGLEYTRHRKANK